MCSFASVLSSKVPATLFDSMIIIMMMMQKIVLMTRCMNQSMQAIDKTIHLVNCLHELIHTSGHHDDLLHHYHDYDIDHAVKQGRRGHC